MSERSHSKREGQKKITGDSYEKECYDWMLRAIEQLKLTNMCYVDFKPGKLPIFDRLANKIVTVDPDMLLRDANTKNILMYIGCKYSQRDRWLQDDRHARVVLDNQKLPWIQFTREKYGAKAKCPIENLYAWMGDITDIGGLKRVITKIIIEQ